MGSGMDSKADNVAQIWLYKNTPLQTTLPATLQSGARPFTPVRSLLYYACEYHVNTHTHTHTHCMCCYRYISQPKRMCCHGYHTMRIWIYRSLQNRSEQISSSPRNQVQVDRAVRHIHCRTTVQQPTRSYLDAPDVERS